jgi:glycosyltransferase involved in cell wall biosynthesis
LSENFKDYEIIVVDDGSTDQTQDVCRNLEKKLGERFKAIVHLQNKGYGAALRTGLFSAKKELIFYTDADNQFDIRQILEFVKFIDDFDLVIGYREKRRYSWVRLLTSKTYNLLVLAVFGLRVNDINCSFKLFSRARLAQLSIECDDFFADTELLLKARQLGFKIKQLPVSHFPRAAGKSTVKLSHIFETLKDILKYGRKFL